MIELGEKLLSALTFQRGVEEFFLVVAPILTALVLYVVWRVVTRPPAKTAHEPIETLDLGKLPPIKTGSTLRAEWGIAWGHLRSKKTDAFLSVVTVFSILGVTTGVALLNCVTAVMTGFEHDLRDKILGANAHVVVFRHDGNVLDAKENIAKINAVDGVTAAAPFLYTPLMLKAPLGPAGIVVKGIDPLLTADVTHLLGDLRKGYSPDRSQARTYEQGQEDDTRAFLATFDEPFPLVTPGGFAPPPEAKTEEYPGIIIGEDLAEQLAISTGQVVQLVNPLGGGSGPLGMPTPSLNNMRVAGVFKSGMAEYDTKWTYVSNKVVQDFLKVGNTHTGFEIRIDDIDDADARAREIERSLGHPYYAKTWMDLNEKLFVALEFEKWVMGVLLYMIVANAGLMVVTTLFMLVLTKGREIAILKALGATSASIMRIFIMEGAAIGIVGTILGTLLGMWGCEILRRYEYPLETDVYYVSTLPVVVDASTVAFIAASALVTCLVATIFPARRAASIDPVAALRYE